VDWLNISGMAVLIEDTGIVLSDEALISRITSLGGVEANNNALINSTVLDLPIGRTLVLSGALASTQEGNSAAWVELNLIYRGTTLYIIAFTGRENQFETQRETFNLILNNLQVVENTSAEPSPEVTEEAAPAGYKWGTINNIRLLVPVAWVSIPIDGILEVGESFMGDKMESPYIREYIARQTEMGAYVSLLDFSGIMVMVEDTNFVLPANLLQDRYAEMASNAGIQYIEAPILKETPLGEVIYGYGFVTAESNTDTRNYLELYGLYRGTRLYTIGFAAVGNDFAEKREVFDTILASIQYGEASPSPEATAEATEIILPNMPADWKIARGERTAYAVPSNFVVTRGTNRALLNASINMIMGSEANTDSLSSIFNQIDIDIIAGNLVGTDLFFTASLYQESLLSTDLETAEELVLGMFQAIAEADDINFTVLDSTFVSLPIGQTVRTNARIEIPNRPSLRSNYYIYMTEDGMRMYALAFSLLESEAERLLPQAESIAQTFTILE
jgi:hypothetical protein